MPALPRRSLAAAAACLAASLAFALSGGHAHARADVDATVPARIVAAMSADIAPSAMNDRAASMLHTARDAGDISESFVIAPAVFWREIFPGLLLLLATAVGVSLGYWQLRREVMRRRAVEAQLQAARDLADSAALAKSTFLATMSHEIRTPLSGIIGMLDLLMRASMGSEQRQMLGAINAATHSLLQMLDQVMDFSKMEANRMSLESVPVDLRAMVQSVVMVMGEPARRRGVKTSYEVDDALSDALLGDPLRIRQILTNLISNAAKFTAHGEVRLTLTVDAADAGHQSLRFVVADTGIGIPREKLAQVMTPFRQADTSISRHYGGSGLGLSVSSRLAALMGGQLLLSSAPGQGTRATFVCRLPVARNAGASAGMRPLASPTPMPAPMPLALTRPASGALADAGDPSRSPDSGASASAALAQAGPVASPPIPPETGPGPDAPRLLVVDDHAINRDLIRRQLATLGYACDARSDGATALQALRSGRYAMLLTDCQMPAMSGAELVQAWRQEESRCGVARLPIAMLTARPQSEPSCDPDIDAHIRKPVTLDRLRAVLLECLPPEAVTAGLAMDCAPVAPRGGLALPVLRENFRQDDAALRGFLQTSLAALRTDLAQARSGLCPQFCERYADWLHRALGALGMLGHWPVIEQGNALEAALRNAPGAELLPDMHDFLRDFARTIDDIERELRQL
ncbi:histidine kinase [Bordetella sputigena]|uniref:hybrid sensor histidine kinase/response regulator n=1 Tax=Bordetella sputigena TaxID=1416810 RepID=UPI0039EE95A8